MDSNSYKDLIPTNWESILPLWFQEDIPSFDYGGYVVGTKPSIAHLYQKSAGVLAGVPFVNKIVQYTGCTIEWHSPEGTVQLDNSRVHVATVRGPANAILTAERIALNLICRASGIATVSRQLATLGKKHGWSGRAAGTRKTTPGFRLVEKYAMLVGGVDCHRMDLSGMIMLKDNHIVSHGNITNAVKSALSVGGFSVKVEVECQNEAEAVEAIDAGAHVVMLDNFKPEEAKVTAKNLKEHSKHTIVEVSGGITLENIVDYFSPNVDIISTSTTSQSVPHIDFSMKLVRD